MYLQEPAPIGPEDDYGIVASDLAALSGDLVLRALDEDPEPVAQDEDGMTYAEKIGPDDRRLDPARTPAENARVVRALSPHIGAKAGELGVWRATASTRACAGGGDGRA